MEVHSTLKCGFYEVIYQWALEKEMLLRSLKIHRQFDIPVLYRGEKVGSRKDDFLVENKVPVELKAVAKLEDTHIAQAVN